MIKNRFKDNFFSMPPISSINSYKIILNRVYNNLLVKEPFSNLINSKPCYCNIFFACLAHKVLKLSKIKKPPICKCRKRKSGIPPPSFYYL